MIVHKNGSFLNAGCESKAVRIRPVSGHIMWPNIPGTTLLFSSIKYYFKDALDQIGAIVFYDFHKAVKPNYG